LFQREYQIYLIIFSQREMKLDFSLQIENNLKLKIGDGRRRKEIR
jgi:hypothetical protein